MLSFTYKCFVLDVDHICFTASIQKYLDDITSFLNKKKKRSKTPLADCGRISHFSQITALAHGCHFAVDSE